MVIVFGTMRSNQSDEALPFSGDGWNAIQKPMERCQGFVFSFGGVEAKKSIGGDGVFLDQSQLPFFFSTRS